MVCGKNCHKTGVGEKSGFMITMENFSPENRDVKIGYSTYRICLNEDGKWFISESHNSPDSWYRTRSFYSDNLQEVIDKINSFTKEGEVYNVRRG